MARNRFNFAGLGRTRLTPATKTTGRHEETPILAAHEFSFDPPVFACITGAIPMPCDLIHVTMQHPPSMWRLSGPAMLIVRPDRHVGAVIEPHNHIGMGPRAAAAVALGAPSATVSP